MAKRSFAEFAAGSDSNLTVITADGGRIPAHYDVSNICCKVQQCVFCAFLTGNGSRLCRTACRHRAAVSKCCIAGTTYSVACKQDGCSGSYKRSIMSIGCVLATMQSTAGCLWLVFAGAASGVQLPAECSCK
jgi:hypothetical protein